jgi:hypothetical protein
MFYVFHIASNHSFDIGYWVAHHLATAAMYLPARLQSGCNVTNVRDAYHRQEQLVWFMIHVQRDA